MNEIKLWKYLTNYGANSDFGDNCTHLIKRYIKNVPQFVQDLTIL